MPYYPDDQSEENLDRIRWDNVCAVCKRRLYIYLDKDGKKYIACPTPGHEGIAKEYQPQATDYRSNLWRQYEMEKEHGRETSKALAQVPKHGQLTQPEAMHILKLVYPDVPEDEIVRCAILCRDFALHPLMKEVYIIPFGQGEKRTWSTVLGINATRKLMAQRGTYSYIDDTPRLMTDDEQKRIFGDIDAENIVAITKLRTKDGLEAPGYGRWPKDKQPYGMDKGNTKANMAFIRSERNAFGRLSPDVLPPGLEIIDEAYVEGVGAVDKTTGEILEGDYTVVEEEEKPGEKPKGKRQPKAKPEPEAEAKDPLQPESETEETVEKDETPVTPEQLDNLVKLMNESGMSYSDLNQFCNPERGWNIRDFKTELKKWQYDIILEAFAKGKP